MLKNRRYNSSKSKRKATIETNLEVEDPKSAKHGYVYSTDYQDPTDSSFQTRSS